MVHERSGLRSIRPDNDTGRGGVIAVVGLRGGEQEGRAGQHRAEHPDGHHQHH